MVFWNVTTCNLIAIRFLSDVLPPSSGLEDEFLRKVCTCLTSYTSSYTRRQQPSQYWYLLHYGFSCTCLLVVSWLFVPISYRFKLTVLCVMPSYHKTVGTPCGLPLCRAGQFTEKRCGAVQLYVTAYLIKCYLTLVFYAVFPTSGRFKT